MASVPSSSSSLFGSTLLRRLSSLYSSIAEPSPSKRSSPSPFVSGSTISSSGGGGDGGEPDPKRRRLHSEPQLDELNTLLRHPALYDPVLAPRHPIVLCHGLYGFGSRGPSFFRLHYWGDLLKILRGKVGAEVIVTSVPGTGAVRERARVLHEALENTPGVLGRDLNFLAHSMGGLDARYLLSNIRPTSYNPRSLTTISTPHRGSDFMSWCRTNIGIGTDFDKHSEAAAKLAHQETDPIPLPFSLKQPILSRTQVEAAKEAAKAAKLAKDAAEKAAEKVKETAFGNLPFSLTTSVSGYLLDLLDSPAYANLTPNFLRDVFNPGTPDRPDIRYFSVAARTDRISIWHPLWLPKMVLDGAEAAREANGIHTDPRWRGNDGLVNIESAKWGEFLGILEGADHWEVRGSSGLSDAAASAKAVAEAEAGGKKADEVVKAKAEKAASKKEKEGSSWSWQDLYALVGAGGDEKLPKEGEAKRLGPRDGERNYNGVDTARASSSHAGATKASTGANDDSNNLANVATWIIRHLPYISSSSSTRTSPPKSPPLRPPSLDPLLPARNDAARLQYGAPVSSASSGASTSGGERGKPEKFDLERLTLALCRKLHNEGL